MSHTETVHEHLAGGTLLRKWSDDYGTYHDYLLAHSPRQGSEQLITLQHINANPGVESAYLISASSYSGASVVNQAIYLSSETMNALCHVWMNRHQAEAKEAREEEEKGMDIGGE